MTDHLFVIALHEYFEIEGSVCFSILQQFK